LSRVRVRRALGAAALTVLLAVACSGSKPNTPATGGTFADATCADLANWAGAIRQAYTDLQGVGQLDASSLTSTKEQLRALSVDLQTADRATQRLSDGISGRRAPDIDNGEQIKQTVLDTLKKLRDSGKAARAEIDAFDPQAATRDSAEKLRSDLNTLTSGIEEALTGLAPLLTSNAQLRSALENSATCRRAGSDLFSS